ncbi:MAG: hypothetical protein IPH75_06125 [bacterium]|nr:hypothetical protein [bacterium]
MARRVLVSVLMCVCLLSTLPTCDSDNPIVEHGIDTLIDTVYFRDFDYAEGRIYDVMQPGYLSPNDKIVDLSAFEQRIIVRPEDGSLLFSALFLNHPDSPLAATDFYSRAEKIPNDQLQWFDEPTGNRHYVVFNSSRRDYGLGLWMLVERRDASNNILDTFEIGSLVADTIRLKSIRGYGAMNPTHPAWDLVWRNCYFIPRGASAAELNTRVFFGELGTESTDSAVDYLRVGSVAQNYLQILGLDQFNDQTGERFPDRKMDDLPTVFRPDWGLIIFPSRTPFATDTVFYDAIQNASLPLQVSVPTLYHYTSFRERFDSSRYFIRQEFRTIVKW